MKFSTILKGVLFAGISSFFLIKGAFAAEPVQIKDDTLYQQLRGQIILQVEQHGEAYYVHPEKKTLHYLGRPADALEIMSDLGLGITNTHLDLLKGEGAHKGEQDEKLSEKLSGKILLQIEDLGQAWYIWPQNNERYYLGRPSDALRVFKQLGLGISDDHLKQLVHGSTVLTPGHARGIVNPVYTIDLFCSFDEPYCAKHIPTLKSLQATFIDKDQIDIRFHHFPLSFLEASTFLAHASECLAQQTNDQVFWEFVEYTYSSEFMNRKNKFDRSFITKRWNVDDQALNSCIDSKQHQEILDADALLVEKYEVSGSPHAILRHRDGREHIVVGAQPIEAYLSVIDYWTE